MEVGWREGRDPGPEFATSAYLKANADVAASGINPLLHYIEFGHAEGRGTFAHRAFRQGPPRSFSFPTSAPVVSFLLPGQPIASWQRSYRLDSLRPGFLKIGVFPAGYARNPAMQARICAATRLLGLLSGFGGETAREKSSELPSPPSALVDAWYVNAAQMRTRWTGQTLPFVVRAFQHAGPGDDTISLLGEGLVSSAVDLVDFHLNSEFLPMLFVFARPDGTLIGTMILAFPSLCRGGCHYVELVSSATVAAAEGAIDPLRESARLAARLLRLIRSEDGPAISRLEVDVDGADATGRIFQPDVRKWLEKAMRIGVWTRSSDTRSPGESFPAETIAISPSPVRDDEGATLLIGPDMVPTIRALTQRRTQRKSSVSSVVAPLLVADQQVAQPAACIELPGISVGDLEAPRYEIVTKWPRLIGRQGTGLPTSFPPAAIRAPRRRNLHDVELLTPVGEGGFDVPAGVRKAITWLIDVHETATEHVVNAVLALARQNGGTADAITFVGSPDPHAILVARAAFEDRIHKISDLRTAVRDLTTPLAGFISADLVLHDNRSAGVFSAMLDDDSVGTAGCVLISTERRGKAWHAAIVDPGALRAANGRLLDGPEKSAAAERLFRSTYPVTVPSRELWVARSPMLASWVDGAAQSDRAVHLCTSLITATRSRKRAELSIPSFIPRASEDCTTKIEVLTG